MSRSTSGLLLLDTHYWIWLQSGMKEQISRRMLSTIERAAATGNLLVSVMSIWEVGMLEAKGRIRLNSPCEQWVKEALGTPGLTLAALTPEIALDSTRLPGRFHGDPADRIIVATARRAEAKLVTRDQGMMEYGRQRHVTLLN